MRKLPAIISDIDGVLLRTKDIIKGSDKALNFIRQPLQKIFPNMPNLEQYNQQHNLIQDRLPSVQRLPFVCLTNGGGVLEQKKADQLNQYLNLNNNKNENGQILFEKLHKEDIILNYTPLRPILEQNYTNQPVLLIGTGDIKQIAESMGLKKFITIDEYTSLFPHLVNVFPHERMNKFEVRSEIQKRFGLRNQYSLLYPLQINGIFLLNDPVYWEDCIQVMCDLCSSENGKVLHRLVPHNKKHIPIYTVNNDLTFSAKFHIDRFAFGPFTQLFKSVFYKIYSYYPQIIEYGKPTTNTYQFTENYIKSKTPYEISNFYMIGDNPKSDIRGANKQGWTSILVKTGVFPADQENDKEDPANFVVENFQEAVQLIMDLEKIPCNLINKK